MSFFGWVAKSDFDNFQSETTQKFERLEEEIRNKATDSDETARTAAQNANTAALAAASIRDEMASLLEEIKRHKTSAIEDLNLIQIERKSIFENSENLKRQIEETERIYGEILEQKGFSEQAGLEIQQRIVELEKHVESARNLPDEVIAVNDLLNSCKTMVENITSLLSHSVKRKAEIDDLHKEIYGQDIVDESGKFEHIDGKKDELERSYMGIQNKLTSIDQEVKEAITISEEKHNAELEEIKSKSAKFLLESEARVNAVNEQLTNLLPGALAAGLSAAYESKKEEEIKALGTFDKSFKSSISEPVKISV